MRVTTVRASEPVGADCIAQYRGHVHALHSLRGRGVLRVGRERATASTRFVRLTQRALDDLYSSTMVRDVLSIRGER